jgi:hypothetical protein
VTGHAPIGASVVIVTEGEAVHGHKFEAGQRGEVIGYVGPWAVVRVPGSGVESGVGGNTQVLDPEDYEIEEPGMCNAEIRHATRYEPPEFCEAETDPGREFCPAHDPDVAYDLEVERAEALREDRR